MNNLRNGSKYDGTHDASFIIYRKVSRAEVFIKYIEMDEYAIEKMSSVIASLNKYDARNNPEKAKESTKTLIAIAKENGLTGNLVFKTLIRDGSELFNNKALIKDIK